jgi:D-amino peptidase
MKKLHTIFPLIMLLCFSFACQQGEETAELEEQEEAGGLPGFIFSEPAPNSDEKITIMLRYDMEGLSGQDDYRTAFVYYPEQYEKGRELLTADVNAVIEGLFDGGADEIYVVDSHGSGSRKPDIILEKMDSRAKLKTDRELIKAQDEIHIDAIAVVGDHSRTGGGGFMAHTRTYGMDFIINGRSVNETELVMLDFGTNKNIPLIFASGDDKLKEQLQPYPWIEYVTVKFATSASTADLRPVEEVHEEMRAAAIRAVKNIPSAKAVKLKVPFKAGLRAAPPASLRILSRLPGIDYQNETVTYEADDYWDARMNIWTALVGIATNGHAQFQNEWMWEKLEDRPKIRLEITDAQLQRWLDYESGRWKPPKK